MIESLSPSSSPTRQSDSSKRLRFPSLTRTTKNDLLTNSSSKFDEINNHIQTNSLDCNNQMTTMKQQLQQLSNSIDNENDTTLLTTTTTTTTVEVKVKTTKTSSSSSASRKRKLNGIDETINTTTMTNNNNNNDKLDKEHEQDDDEQKQPPPAPPLQHDKQQTVTKKKVIHLYIGIQLMRERQKGNSISISFLRVCVRVESPRDMNAFKYYISIIRTMSNGLFDF